MENLNIIGWIKYYCVMMYGEAEVQLLAFLTSTVDGS